MKKLLFLALAAIILSSCKKKDDDRNFKQDMREFVIGLSQYSKGLKPNFIIIPQNGIELVTETGEDADALATSYLNAIDGHGQEDLFYGYNDDDVATPTADSDYLQLFLDRSNAEGNRILVIDYCSTPSKMDNSYSVNDAAGYISFAADHRELNNIPSYPSPIFHENNSDVSTLAQAKNFLYLINPDNFATKADFISAVTATNYDLLVMDLFFQDGSEFLASEVAQLRTKANGGSRLVICYMSIGEAEDYRYYWQNSWSSNKPSWLRDENPDWAGNYKVAYWDASWQQIIYGNNSSYLKKILDADFDGVYLDIIDAYEYFEAQ